MTIKKIIIFFATIILTSCGSVDNNTPTKTMFIPNTEIFPITETVNPTNTPYPTLIPTPTPATFDLKDGGLLSELPCSAPCFYEMTAGQTELDEVIDILSQQGIDNCKIETSQIHCWRGGGYFDQFNIGFKNELISSIFFQPHKSVTLGDVLDKLGQPSHVTLIDRTIMWGSPIMDIGVYYDGFRMKLGSTHHPGAEILFEKDTRIEAWVYYDKISYQESLLQLESSSETFPSRVFNWNGYGIYSLDK